MPPRLGYGCDEQKKLPAAFVHRTTTHDMWSVMGGQEGTQIDE